MFYQAVVAYVGVLIRAVLGRSLLVDTGGMVVGIGSRPGNPMGAGIWIFNLNV